MSSGIPIQTLAFDNGSGVVEVSSANPLPITGAGGGGGGDASAANQVTGNNTLSSINSKLPTLDGSGRVPQITPELTATGNITTQNLVPAGAATANSSVTLSTNGFPSLMVQVTGTYTGALSLQVTVDGSTWVTLGGTPFINLNTGGYLASITSALQSIFQADVAGALQVRISALAATTGTAVVTLRATPTGSGMVALDAAIPTGTNTIGAVNIAATQTLATVTTVGSLTTLANGQTAHSAASTGSPLRIGGRVNTAVDTTLVAGDASDLFISTGGAAITKPYAVPELDWVYAAAASGISNTTTAVTIKAAAAASVRNYITGIDISTDGALGAASEVAIRDGAGGTVLWRMKIGTAGLPNGRTIEFPTPLKGTAATLLEVVTLTASVTGAVYFNAQGYTAI